MGHTEEKGMSNKVNKVSDNLYGIWHIDENYKSLSIAQMPQRAKSCKELY